MTQATDEHGRLTVGTRAPTLELPSIDGSRFDTSALSGRRFMLSFYRFASCPFCNFRIHELITRLPELREGFPLVAVFDSPLDNLTRHASRHEAPFPILADETGEAYRRFGIEHSVARVLKGVVTRAPTLMKAMAMGYVPLRIRGRVTTMPADFLIDEDGIIRTAYYGGDEGDHIPFDEVRTFSEGAI